MYYLLKTPLNTYKVLISNNNIKFGGKYKDCININILDSETAYISHIESQPECGFMRNLEEGETVDFILGALEFVKKLYPTVTKFTLDDTSHIECDSSSKKQSLPRKQKKPLSLAPLYITQKGYTWYEYRFGARMKSEKEYQIYRNKIKKFEEKINMSFNDFKFKIIRDMSENYDFLKTYFESANSWFEFFQTIPKKNHCEAFYNWLPFFVSSFLDNKYNPYGWIIEYEQLEKIPIEINEINKTEYNSNTNILNKTRRNNNKNRMRITNTNLNTSNII